MLFDRADFPRSEAFVLANARVPRCVLDAHLRFSGEDLIKVDIVVAGSSIAAITPAGIVQHGLYGADIDSGIVLPRFTDMHTHLDKGHICSRTSNLDGTFSGALEAVRRDRPFWSIEDVMMRMEFALRCAFAHGTHLLHTSRLSAGQLSCGSLGIFGGPKSLARSDFPAGGRDVSTRSCRRRAILR